MAMAPHSSTLAWKIPWREEPGGLQFMRSLRVGHDWATSLSLFTFMHWGRKWQPTPVFLPGESQGRGWGRAGGLPSMGSHRVGHDWSDLAAAAAVAFCCVCVCIYMHTCHILLIHSSVDEHLGCICILVIINNAAMNIVVCVSSQISVFGFFWVHAQEWNC